jgi:hypothetical protein
MADEASWFGEITKMVLTAFLGGAGTYFYQKRMKSREELGDVRKEILKNMLEGVRAVELSASAYAQTLWDIRAQFGLSNTYERVKELVDLAKSKGKELTEALTIHRMYVKSLKFDPTERDIASGIITVDLVLTVIGANYCGMHATEKRELTPKEKGNLDKEVTQTREILKQLQTKIDETIKTLLSGEVPR